MSDGPWTKFQATQTQDAGPWSKFAQPEVSKEIAPPDTSEEIKKRRALTIAKVPTVPLPGEQAGGMITSPYRFEEAVKTAEGPGKELGKDLRTGALSLAGAGIGGGLAGELAPAAKASAGGSKFLQWLLPAMARGTATGAGAGAGTLAAGGTPKEALGTAATFTGAEVGGEASLGALKKILGKSGEEAQRINKLLGVKAKQVIPGKTPESLDAFVANPARGARKYGLDEKALAKMDPLERNNAVMAARDKAGQQLDQVLSQAQGKTVNIQPAIEKSFQDILDPKVAKQAEERLQQILAKNKITKPLSQLSPMEARSIQRDLDKFAKFTGEDTKSFGDMARKIRRGISEATRKAVPESAPFDQDYTDLKNASDATQNQLKQFGAKAPENKLRKWIIRAAGLGGAYELGKSTKEHFIPTIP